MRLHGALLEAAAAVQYHQHCPHPHLAGTWLAAAPKLTPSPLDQAYQFGPIKLSSSQVFLRTQLSYAFVNLKPIVPGALAPLAGGCRAERLLLGLAQWPATRLRSCCRRAPPAAPGACC